MNTLQRYWRPLALVPVLVALLVSTTHAQSLRSDRTVYLTPKVGLASYFGDNEETPVNFNFDMFDPGFPYSVGAELGYQFTPGFGLGLGYLFGNYTQVTDNIASVAGEADLDDFLSDYRKRHSIMLLARYTFAAASARVAPYVQGGLHYTLGDVAYCTTDPRPASFPACELEADVDPGPMGRFEEKSNGFLGPHLGVGLDIRLAQQVSLMVEASSNIVTDDDGLDGTDQDGGFAAFDMFNFLGLGLKIDFKKPFMPVEVLSIEVPGELESNQEGTFTATVNEEEATQPITYTWDFGDGTTATGQTVQHSYSQDGDYTVTFTASNERASDSATETVTVYTPVPAEIVTITADPPSADTQTPVAFTSNVQGDEPITYEWDFGDGSTGTGANPTHTFTEPGTYTVTLNVSNEAGEDSGTVTVTVEPYEPEYCATLTELNSAFFDRNASTLTEEARQALTENVEVLTECVTVNARVEGFAAPGERNPQQLSEDRARAVEQFYTDNGILASRLNVIGLGVVEGMTSKKEGAAEARRVDSIPVR